MRRCLKMPSRWNASGQWYNRWHALFCPECRRARQADQKLVRGARALRQPPLPPELRAQIFERLGLPPAEANAQPSASDAWTLPPSGTLPEGGQPRVRRATLSMGAAAAALLFAAASLSLVRSAHHRKLISPPVPLVHRPPLPTNLPRLRPAPPPARSEAGPQFVQLPLQSSVGNTDAELLPSSVVRAGTKKPVVDGPRLHPLVHGRQPAVRHPSVAVDDLAYVNEAPGETVRRWAPLRAVEWHSLEAQIRRTVHVRDDFVQIPFPRLASTSERQIAEAVEQYKKEAAIIDPRLAREVTLSVRAIAFSDLCDRLRADTGIEISADPGVADEKVTIFCEKRPLREVMREITHVFGFTWLRSGAEGEYRYQLMQDLRSQLAEEQLRNQDVQQALLDLDKQMSIYRPYLDQSVDQLLARLDQLQPGWEKLSQEEKGRLWTLIANGNLQSLSGGRQYPLISRLVKSGGWGPAMLYFRLSPAERSTLLAGGRLEFSMDDPNPERRLPADWRVPLLKSTGLRVFPSGVILQSYGAPPDKPSTPVDQAPNTEPVVNLELDRSEAGELTLKGGTYVNNVDPSTEKIISADGVRWTMATGRSPSTTKPDNAAANQALRTKSLFRRVIDLQPRPSCPRLAADEERARKGEPDPLYQMAFDPELRGPHVNTADVWEAIHQRTGLPVVADSYLHIFPLSSVTVKQSSTFDALCQVGDQMGVRWKKEGDFLLGRSTSYFWDELKEVPNRLLRRWQQDSRANNGLPLADLLEMASLSDQQLGSKTVGEQICHCWELDEWQIVGTGPMLPLSAQRLYGVDVRKYARVLSMLTPAQLKQAQQPEGVALADLKAAPREALLERFQYLLSDLPASTPLRLQVDYIPSGSFIWSPLITMAQFKAGADRWPTIWGTSVEKALAAARRYDPNAEAGSMRPTGGRLDFTFVLPDGKRLSTGGPGVMVETG